MLDACIVMRPRFSGGSGVAEEIRRKGQPRGILAYAIVATTATTLPVFLLGALEPVLRGALGLRPGTEGLAVGGFFLAGVVGAVWAGRLLHRVRASVLVRAGAAASAGASGAVAGLVHGAVGLAGALVVAGAANGVLQPGVNELLARLVRPGRRGWAFGVKQAAIPCATLIAGLALPLVALRSSWRFAYGGAALLALAMALLGAPGVGRRGEVPHAATPLHVPGVLLVVSAAMALGAGAANALGAFGVASLVHDRVQPATAGYVAALGSFAGLGTRLAMGWVADRHLARPLATVGLMLAVGAVGYAALATGLRALLLAGVVLGYAGGWGWNGLVNFAVSQLWPDHPGQATALVQAGAFAGSVVGPIGFGALVESAGFHAAWVIDGLGALGAAAGMLGAASVLYYHGRGSRRRLGRAGA